jgi:hypothetical protein
MRNGEPDSTSSPPDDFDTLKPSERFARLAHKLFSLKKSDVDAHLKEHPLPPLKRGPKPKPQ